MGEEDDKITSAIQKWLGRMVVLGIPFVLIGAIGTWVSVRDLLGAMDRIESRVAVLEEFRVKGDRWTKDDAKGEQIRATENQLRNDKKFDSIESDIDTLDNRISRVHDEIQGHERGAAGWVALIKQNVKDIAVFRQDLKEHTRGTPLHSPGRN